MAWGAIGGAVAGSVVSSALGGGGGGGTAPSQQPVTVPGAEFQPFTYRGTGGFGVTGTQLGGDGYSWSADIPDWIKALGETGAGAAGSLFDQYAALAGQSPYEAAQEYYSRGLAQLEPEIAKQRTALGGSLFGSGRLGLKLAGEGLGYGADAGQVNPDVAGFGAGVGKAYTDLYSNALTRGQALQTQYLNQLSGAAAKMLELGMKPNEIEQNLINFGADLETARSTALKAGTAFVPLKETRESVLNAQLANTIGAAAGDYVKTGMDTGNWSLFGGGNSGLSSSGGVANWLTSNGMYDAGGLFASPQQLSGAF
jgi:hypothetical protein